MPVPISLQYADQAVSLPANYTLPPGQAFRFSSVTARINGGGASGDFIVVLDLLSQDDKVIASARIDEEFAAGDTGVVSFAPDFRRKPAAVTPPPSGGLISYAVWSVDNFAIGVGATDVDFASIDATFDSSDHFDLTAGGDIEVNDAGVYMLHIAFNNFTMAASEDAQLFINVDVVSGSVGTWSNRPGSTELTGDLIYNIVSDNASAVQGAGDRVYSAIIGWTPAATFPVVIRVVATWLINEVETAATPDIRAAMVRFGDGD